MARPPAGAAGHSLATYKGAISYGQGLLQRGDQLLPRPPTQGAADCGQLIGVAAARGHDHLQCAQGAAASRGSYTGWLGQSPPT
ncbi:hypothetical protein B296_00016663 [Ensete ventricosum]|uniref:Uncharacterized protein n=1 Tax=Ensete ventricosum TaxID=4639 RepID=A0A426YEJ2_ENSVE|nr:hypothetical protein B296_00016663 [Ensete ventricosum]